MTSKVPLAREPTGWGSTVTTVAVIGKQDSRSRRLESALKGRRFVLNYCSADDVLASSPARPRPALSKLLGARTLYVINVPASPAGAGKSALAKRWVDVILKLEKLQPRAPIVVAADEAEQKDVIRGALGAGATEVLGNASFEVEELVKVRVESALKAAAMEGWSGVPQVREEPAVSMHEGDRALASLRASAADLPTREERSAPLADILRVAAINLRAPSGRLDARKVADRLGVSLSRLASAMPVSRQAVSQNPDSPALQAALDPFARALDVASQLLPGDRLAQWLNATHPRLQGSTPLQAMLGGRAERVARLLESALRGGVD